MAFGRVRRQAGGGGKRAGQVGMAAMVILAAMAQERMGIGVAARADHVMDRAAEGIEPVPVERVMRDRRHRAQMGQAGPEPVAGRQMRAVQRPRLAREEAFGEVMRGPEVEVAHLRAADRMDAEELPGGHGEGHGIARGGGMARDRRERGARAGVKLHRRGWQAVDGVADDGGHGAAGGSIGGCEGLGNGRFHGGGGLSRELRRAKEQACALVSRGVAALLARALDVGGASF